MPDDVLERAAVGLDSFVRNVAGWPINAVWDALATHLRDVDSRHRQVRCVNVGGTDSMCAACRNCPTKYDEIGWPCVEWKSAAALARVVLGEPA